MCRFGATDLLQIRYIHLNSQARVDLLFVKRHPATLMIQGSTCDECLLQDHSTWLPFIGVGEPQELLQCGEDWR